MPIPTTPISFDGFRGEVLARYASDALLDWLRALPARTDSAEAELIHRGRNCIVRLPFPFEAAPAGVTVKRFARQPYWRAWLYARRGGKAAMSFRNAIHLHSHGVGVAEPIGYVERCEGGRLVESFFISAYLPDRTDLRREMKRLVGSADGIESCRPLLQAVAAEIRRMHDSGFVHHDLGGQNLLLKALGPCAWGGFAFIDLNRGRVCRSVGLAARARDLARLEIPAERRREFFELYFGGVEVPRVFVACEGLVRWRRWVHVKTRRLRHPARSVGRCADPGEAESGST